MQEQEKRVFVRVPVVLTAHCRIGNRFIRDAVADLNPPAALITMNKQKGD